MKIIVESVPEPEYIADPNTGMQYYAGDVRIEATLLKIVEDPLIGKPCIKMEIVVIGTNGIKSETKKVTLHLNEMFIASETIMVEVG